MYSQSERWLGLNEKKEKRKTKNKYRTDGRNMLKNNRDKQRRQYKETQIKEETIVET